MPERKREKERGRGRESEEEGGSMLGLFMVWGGYPSLLTEGLWPPRGRTSWCRAAQRSIAWAGTLEETTALIFLFLLRLHLPLPSPDITGSLWAGPGRSLWAGPGRSLWAALYGKPG